MEQLLNRISNLDSVLDQFLAGIDAEKDALARLNFLAGGIENISESVVEIGDFCAEAIDDSPKSIEFLPYYFINFSWNECAKSFLLLLRNVLFEEQKAHIMRLEDVVDQQTVGTLLASTMQVVQTATTELKEFFPVEIKGIKAQKDGGAKQVGKWALQDSPQAVYRNQLHQISVQAYSLVEQYLEEVKLAGQMAQVREAISDTINECSKDLHRIKSVTESTIEYVGSNASKNIGKIAVKLEDLEAEAVSNEYNRTFKSKLEKLLDEMKQRNIFVVAAKDGLLQQREINYQKRARNWLDAEVLPLLYEVWELTEDATNGLKMTLVNVRNRAILLANEAKAKGKLDIAPSDLSHPLESFLKKVEDTEKGLVSLKSVVTKRIENSFNLSSVFELEDEYLYVPLEKTLHQFKLNENKVVVEARQMIKKQVGIFQNFKSSVERKEHQSISEKIVQYVQDHTLQDTNSQYSSIFLTKGHIGESFWVGRKQEMMRMASLIGDWKNGFRGATILSGKRFSGKSFFGDAVAARFFKNNMVRLTPGTDINFKGRKFNAGFDLEEALDFVQKTTLNEHPLIWIDDLELWADNEFSLGQNARKLCQFIDRHYDKAFVLASMCNWAKARLDKAINLDAAFSAEINLDSMSFGEILEAIVIRHGATHKTLVDESGKEVSAQQFRHSASSIYKRNDGNIGNALQEWATRMEMLEDDKVTTKSTSPTTLPEFLTLESSMLMSTILMERRTNEYRLRKMFGPSFKDNYSYMLQRLISMGLLCRTLDGWLELDDSVANDVARMLDKKKYLTYQK